MEVFSLLKFWRNLATDSTAGTVDLRNPPPENSDGEEDDSFFDLVLTGPNYGSKQVIVEENYSNISSTSVHVNKSLDNDHHKQHQHNTNNRNKLSKRDGDVVSIRKVLPIETNSKPQSPISLLRSPPKLRVFMLGFKKSSNLDKSESNISTISMAAALDRDNSLRCKMQSEDASPANESFRRGIGVHKYLKMIKPLYARASKIKISDQSVTPLSSPSLNSPRKQAEEKRRSRAATAVFREVCRNLVKSKSATCTVGVVSAPGIRRDDSALQQQDGIQSAILHCKRSYSSSSSSSTILSQGCTMLSRSASDSCHGKAFDQPPRISAEEAKRSSI